MGLKHEIREITLHRVREVHEGGFVEASSYCRRRSVASRREHLLRFSVEIPLQSAVEGRCKPEKALPVGANPGYRLGSFVKPRRRHVFGPFRVEPFLAVLEKLTDL